MQSFEELEAVVNKGGNLFKSFIRKEIELNKNFLQRAFWHAKGEQMTVLNYLIRRHKPEKERDMTAHIRWFLEQGASVNAGQPVHFLLERRRLDLLPLFINEHYVEKLAEDSKGKKNEIFAQRLQLEARDKVGRSLLSRAIDTANASVMDLLLKSGLDVNEENRIEINAKLLDIQPLHQAVLANFPEAIKGLIAAGANFNNPCGKLRETPLLLAARSANIVALEALLTCLDSVNVEVNSRQECLEAVDVNSKRPIDLLCMHLYKKENPQEALRGIAMLLCHGAEVPSNELLRDLLMNNHMALLDEVKKYTKQAPALAANFVRACHDKNNPLHNIIYDNDSWGQIIRRFFGIASKEVFIVESLVFDGSDLLEEESPTISEDEELVEEQDKEDPIEIQVPPKAAKSAVSTVFKKDELVFAEFVWRYRQDFENTFFKNPFSTMLWKLASGECTSENEVRNYAAQHPDTRSDQILKAMVGPPIMHEDLNPDESISPR